MSTPKLEIDMETADRITILNLRDAVKYLEKECEEYIQDGNMPEHKKHDYRYNIAMINHIKCVLEYYGGDYV